MCNHFGQFLFVWQWLKSNTGLFHPTNFKLLFDPYTSLTYPFSKWAAASITYVSSRGKKNQYQKKVFHLMNLEKDDLLAALDPTPAVEYNLVS